MQRFRDVRVPFLVCSWPQLCSDDSVAPGLCSTRLRADAFGSGHRNGNDGRGHDSEER